MNLPLAMVLPALLSAPAQAAQDWKRSSIAPATLAKRIDDAIANLKGTYAETNIALQNEKGKGEARSSVKILSPQAFNIEYVTFSGPRLFTSGIRSDGKELAVMETAGWSKPRPLGSLSAVPTGATLVQAFASNMQRMIWVPITNKKPLFVPLVVALGKGLDGYTLKVEEKSAMVQGRKMTAYRILAQRSPAAAKKLGTGSIEIRIDGARWLPVAARAESKSPKGVERYTRWQAFWRFGQKIDPRETKLAKGG